MSKVTPVLKNMKEVLECAAEEIENLEKQHDELYKLVDTFLYDISNQFEYEKELDPFLEKIREHMRKR